MISSSKRRRVRSELLLAAAVVTALALTACGSGGGNASAGGSSQSTTTVLKAGSISEPDSLDPAEGTGGQDYPFLYSIYDRLLNLDPKSGEVEAGLATKWGFTGADNLQFSLTLRPDITFQDGTPLDAQAVVDSIGHYKSLGHQHDMDPVTSVTAQDASTVVLTLSQPFSALPSALADRAGMIVSPTAVKKSGKDFGRNPVGAGPFSFESWASGTSVELKRYSDYWNDSATHLAGITYQLFPSSTAMSSALTTGQIDYGFSFDPRDLATLKASSQVKVEAEPSLQFYDLAMNNNQAPTNNIFVRQAMNVAIDRDALNKAVLGGSGQPAYLPVPPNSFAFSKLSSSELPKYDPDKAKSLLAQSGLGPNVTVPVCLDAHQSGGSQLFSLIQAQMAKAGIDLQPTVTTGVNCNDQFVSKKTIPVYMKAWSGRPNPYLTYSQNFSATGLYNVGQAPNDGMDAILEQIAKTNTQDDQKPLYDQLNAKFLEDVPYIATLYVPNVVAYSTKVSGDVPNFQGKSNLVALSISK